MMRILVTGGAGFIGSHIVDQLLANDHEVAVFDDLSSGCRDNVPAGVPLFEGDIRNLEAVNDAFVTFAPEGVCHQAAQLSVSRSVREPIFDAEVNGIGLLNVLESCVAHDVERVTFASSGGVLYGDVTEPAPEETPPAPISPYGVTKLLGELYLRFYAREHNLRSVALRYTNVYGPRQNPHGEAGVIAIFSRMMLGGKTPTIYGDGSCVRDYVYVADVARANVAALTQEFDGTHTALNISTGVGTDVNELASLLHGSLRHSLTAHGEDVSSLPTATHGPDRPGDLKSNLASPNKAGDVLGWEPTVDFATGLRETAEWFYQDHHATTGDNEQKVA